MIQSFIPLVQGFGLGAGLIIAIGAQNAFVLRQGLTRSYVFITALICALCDAVLIALGVGGVGTLITRNPWLTTFAQWGGAAFLFWYGARTFWSALRPSALHTDQSAYSATLRGTVLTVLTLSLLNPHVYLDTVVLLGSIGGQYPSDQRVMFGLGAMLASCCWFFGLAYGAAWLAPLFRRPIAWRVLDAGIGTIMWAIALSLI